MEVIKNKSAAKPTKIIYWITTVIIFLAEALMPALTFNTDLAKQGVAHLGYPHYFLIELTVFKVLGGIVLIFPRIAARIKEWAYFGFALDFISAFIGHFVVDGFNGETAFPLVLLLILIISYISFHKLYKVYQ